MNTLHIPKLDAGYDNHPQQIPELMDKVSLPWHTIEYANWKEFPYTPKVAFRIAHTGSHILIHYQATENHIRAVASHDNGNVWEDSCVEFFVSPDCNDTYYNFECNCAGKLLIEYGIPGQREHAPLDVTATVDRWSSLGNEPFETREGCTWQLALAIPVSAFFHHQIQSLNGKAMKANFYKCGDRLPVPHFLSFHPINLPRPCFHCPEFFKGIEFDS